MLSIGGVAWSENYRNDPGTNILFMVMVECTLCGYSMLFNSERLSREHEAVLEPEGS